MKEEDTFWNQDLSETAAVDNKLSRKMDGLNDDFARLMAMQNKLLNEVDEMAKNHRVKAKQIKKKKRKNQKMNQQKAKMKKGCFIPFEIAFYDEKYYQNDESVIRWKDQSIDDLNDCA